MKRIKATPVTNFFPKRHHNDEAQNHRSSNPLDERETEVEEPHDGETEMGTSENPSKEPILDRLTDFDVISLPHDPRLRRKLTDFHINGRDIIRREYVRRGPCQPRDHKFPKTKDNFVVAWFDKFKPWLEYSKENDATFCFVCYLFKSDCVSGGEAFVNKGFRTWSKMMHSLSMSVTIIQKQIVIVFANETTKKVIEELDGGFFGILADESADISDKEQMAFCLRYVDKTGEVKERLLGVVHVGDTTSLTLKVAIEKLLDANSLTLSSGRGQGYDGASNMRGSINGLKTLIMEKTPSAYYVHCFAHQLQLTLVAVAKKNVDCSVLLNSLGILLNVIGSSFLDAIGEFCDGSELVKVESIAFTMRTIDYVFIGQLMIIIFGITNALNKGLQKKNQDIVNVASLVDLTQKNLQKYREDGWTVEQELSLHTLTLTQH
ncbi:uncharacterized protein LOC141601457 [Silene latifolia]|uniref:uncharacterized protein LOC141601457 n=1 Tax=Silene latifolia TaxID=37657 RepID=UPI003D76F8EC